MSQTPTSRTPGEEAPQFRVVSGNPTPAELAALSAVLGAMGEEHANGRLEGVEPVRSAWSHSQRPIRRPIVPGPGAWQRHFD